MNMNIRSIVLVAGLLLVSVLLSGCAIAAYEGYEEYEKQHQEEQSHEKQHKPTAGHS